MLNTKPIPDEPEEKPRRVTIDVIMTTGEVVVTFYDEHGEEFSCIAMPWSEAKVLARNLFGAAVIAEAYSKGDGNASGVFPLN